MSIRFVPVTLDSAQDSHGQLVFRDDRLTAIVTQLGAMHDDLAGQWYVESVFNGSLLRPPTAFPALEDVGAWLEQMRGGTEGSTASEPCGGALGALRTGGRKQP